MKGWQVYLEQACRWQSSKSMQCDKTWLQNCCALSQDVGMCNIEEIYEDEDKMIMGDKSLHHTHVEGICEVTRKTYLSLARLDPIHFAKAKTPYVKVLVNGEKKSQTSTEKMGHHSHEHDFNHVALHDPIWVEISSLQELPH